MAKKKALKKEMARLFSEQVAIHKAIRKAGRNRYIEDDK